MFYNCLLNQIKKAGIISGLFYLASCSVAPQTDTLIKNGWGDLQAHQIANVPFYPQEDFFCGPTTLAEVFNYYGGNYQPEKLAESVYLPDKKGSLQIEMLALSRRENFIPYSGKASLKQVLSWVSQDIPVIALQNLGLDSYPLWHYALIIGMDPKKQTMTLHTGLNASRKLTMKLFENSWRKANYWVLVPLPKNVISADMTEIHYIQAAVDLQEIGNLTLANQALSLATDTWKNNWLAPFFLGNNHLVTEPIKSKLWYETALKRDDKQPDVWNNYAYALAKEGCTEAAISAVTCAITLRPEDENIQSSFSEIQALTQAVKKTSCSFYSCD